MGNQGAFRMAQKKQGKKKRCACADMPRWKIEKKSG